MPAEKKTRKQRAPEKEPVTKGDFTRAAGRKQARVDAIVRNHANAKKTALKRIDGKYAEKLSEELSGTRTEVIALLDLPDFVQLDVDVEDLDESEVSEEAAE